MGEVSDIGHFSFLEWFHHALFSSRNDRNRISKLMITGTAIEFQHGFVGHPLQISLFFVLEDHIWFPAIWVFSVLQLVLGD